MDTKKLIAKFNAYERLMRLDKPIGILLLLWPTLWALWIAGEGRPEPIFIAIFTMGTILMRSAGCVMNDIADRKYDVHVARTQARPLVTGEVRLKEAVVLAALLSLIAFGLVLFLNQLTIKLSFCALFLAASYPLTKRFLAIPQAYLGIAFGFGVPMAFAALTGEIPAVAWLILLSNIFWAVAYDTEYAMVDRDDDLKIGIRSSAIFFGQRDVAIIMMCYAATLVLMAAAGYIVKVQWPYYIGITIAGAIALYHYSLIKNREKKACFKAFLHNNWFGAAIFMGLLFGMY